MWAGFRARAMILRVRALFFCPVQYFVDVGMAAAEVGGRIVNTFGPGDFFGEAAFFGTAVSLRKKNNDSVTVRRSATVRATEHSRFLELTVKDLFDVYGKDLAGLDTILRLVQERKRAVRGVSVGR